MLIIAEPLHRQAIKKKGNKEFEMKRENPEDNSIWRPLCRELDELDLLMAVKIQSKVRWMFTKHDFSPEG